jgi:hypothetical protein
MTHQQIFDAINSDPKNTNKYYFVVICASDEPMVLEATNDKKDQESGFNIGYRSILSLSVAYDPINTAYNNAIAMVERDTRTGKLFVTRLIRYSAE